MVRVNAELLYDYIKLYSQQTKKKAKPRLVLPVIINCF